MDKRYKPLTPLEQLEARRRLLQEIADHPARPIPEVIRQIRMTLRLTIVDYARLCGISARALQDIERKQASPTLATVDKLLKPMSLKLAVVSETPAN
jgi:XRE family transcriptional regulator, regulator of sulfur utilization